MRVRGRISGRAASAIAAIVAATAIAAADDGPAAPPPEPWIGEEIYIETMEVVAAIADLKAWAGAGTDIVKVTDSRPTPGAGDLLEQQFVDVVRVGDSCSGIVIDSRRVLTAAHCMDAMTVEGLAAQRFDVACRRRLGEADAAILTIPKGQSLGLPVRERSHDPGDRPAKGVVLIVGYGATDPTGTIGGGDRRMGKAPTGDWTCTPDRVQSFGCRVGFEVVIASGGSDACKGDSGGPIFRRVNGSWHLVGLVSRGLDGSPTTCGTGGIYTHVGAIDSLIKDEVNRVCEP